MYSPIACALFAILSALGASAAPASSGSPVTTSTVIASAVASDAAIQPTPKVRLSVGDWTSVQSLSDDDAKAPWGGWGHGVPDKSGMASWSFAFADKYKAETFTIETYKKKGEWLATNSSRWDEQAAAKPVVDQKLVVSKGAMPLLVVDHSAPSRPKFPFQLRLFRR